MLKFIILEGELCSPDQIIISVEQELLIKISGGHTCALISLLYLYFVCNVEYPKDCKNAYLFLQRYVLKVFDNVTPSLLFKVV